MADLTKVVLDAMGGDHAPGEMVKGAVDAVSRRQDIKVFLVGHARSRYTCRHGRFAEHCQQW